jgi:anti-sigma B factor antagonist
METNPIVLDDTAGDVIVVVVEGEHDIYTAPTLRERLEEALGRGGGIVVDLTAATFVDSSVLGALLDARRRAIESSQGFVVCVGETVEPGVQRILDITGLVPVLPVVRSRDDAVEAARTDANGAARAPSAPPPRSCWTCRPARRASASSARR